jgi:hypothetical protein
MQKNAPTGRVLRSPIHGCSLLSSPTVHADPATFPALALAHQDRAAVWIEVSLGQSERFTDP